MKRLEDKAKKHQAYCKVKAHTHTHTHTHAHTRTHARIQTHTYTYTGAYLHMHFSCVPPVQECMYMLIWLSTQESQKELEKLRSERSSLTQRIGTMM